MTDHTTWVGATLDYSPRRSRTDHQASGARRENHLYCEPSSGWHSGPRTVKNVDGECESKYYSSYLLLAITEECNL